MFQGIKGVGREGFGVCPRNRGGLELEGGGGQVFIQGTEEVWSPSKEKRGDLWLEGGLGYFLAIQESV